MKVPLLDLKAQYLPLREEIRAAVDKVMDSQNFILGPEVEALESEIAAYSGCRYGIGISSGTDALLVALMAIGLKPGDEVITSPFTFFATVGAIARLGGIPKFVDIDPLTFNLNTLQLDKAFSAKTKAVIPVHLYGQMADMTEIMRISEGKNVCVIEDAAQAIGSERGGKKAGSAGHFGCFSFFPSKNLGGFGDGGMVVTQDPALYEKIKLFRNHGYQPKYYNKVVGGNFRLDAIQAAVLRVKLKYLDSWSAARQKNAALYRKLLSGVKEVKLPYEVPGARHIYNQFVIRAQKRDELMKYLKDREIGTEIYYPVPMHLQECFYYLRLSKGMYPETEKAAESTLALPIYPELTSEMIAFTASSIMDFYKNG